jgi:hypothetical protein
LKDLLGIEKIDLSFYKHIIDTLNPEFNKSILDIINSKENIIIVGDDLKIPVELGRFKAEYNKVVNPFLQCYKYLQFILINSVNAKERYEIKTKFFTVKSNNETSGIGNNGTPIISQIEEMKKQIIELSQKCGYNTDKINNILEVLNKYTEKIQSLHAGIKIKYITPGVVKSDECDKLTKLIYFNNHNISISQEIINLCNLFEGFGSTIISGHEILEKYFLKYEENIKKLSKYLISKKEKTTERYLKLRDECIVKGIIDDVNDLDKYPKIIVFPDLKKLNIDICETFNEKIKATDAQISELTLLIQKYNALKENLSERFVKEKNTFNGVKTEYVTLLGHINTLLDLNIITCEFNDILIEQNDSNDVITNKTNEISRLINKITQMNVLFEHIKSSNDRFLKTDIYTSYTESVNNAIRREFTKIINEFCGNTDINVTDLKKTIDEYKEIISAYSNGLAEFDSLTKIVEIELETLKKYNDINELTSEFEKLKELKELSVTDTLSVSHNPFNKKNEELNTFLENIRGKITVAVADNELEMARYSALEIITSSKYEVSNESKLLEKFKKLVASTTIIMNEAIAIDSINGIKEQFAKEKIELDKKLKKYNETILLKDDTLREILQINQDKLLFLGADQASEITYEIGEIETNINNETSNFDQYPNLLIELKTKYNSFFNETKEKITEIIKELTEKLKEFNKAELLQLLLLKKDVFLNDVAKFKKLLDIHELFKSIEISVLIDKLKDLQNILVTLNLTSGSTDHLITDIKSVLTDFFNEFTQLDLNNTNIGITEIGYFSTIYDNLDSLIKNQKNIFKEIIIEIYSESLYPLYEYFVSQNIIKGDSTIIKDLSQIIDNYAKIYDVYEKAYLLCFRSSTKGGFIKRILEKKHIKNTNKKTARKKGGKVIRTSFRKKKSDNNNIAYGGVGEILDSNPQVFIGILITKFDEQKAHIDRLIQENINEYDISKIKVDIEKYVDLIKGKANVQDFIFEIQSEMPKIYTLIYGYYKNLHDRSIDLLVNPVVNNVDETLNTSEDTIPQFNSIFEKIKYLKEEIKTKTEELNIKLQAYKTAITQKLAEFVNVDTNNSKTRIKNVEINQSSQIPNDTIDISIISSNTQEAINELISKLIQWAENIKNEILEKIRLKNVECSEFNISFSVEGYGEEEINEKKKLLEFTFDDQSNNLDEIKEYYVIFFQTYKNNYDIVGKYFMEFNDKLRTATETADNELLEAKKQLEIKQQNEELDNTLLVVTGTLDNAVVYTKKKCKLPEDSPQNLIKLDGIINDLINELTKQKEELIKERDDNIGEKMKELKTKGEELTKSILKMELAKMLFYVPGERDHTEGQKGIIKDRDSTTGFCIKIADDVIERQQRYTLYLYKNMVKKLKENQKLKEDQELVIPINEIVQCSLPTWSSLEKSKKKMPTFLLHEESAGYIRTWVQHHIVTVFGTEKSTTGACTVTDALKKTAKNVFIDAPTYAATLAKETVTQSYDTTVRPKNLLSRMRERKERFSSNNPLSRLISRTNAPRSQQPSDVLPPNNLVITSPTNHIQSV